MSATTDAAPTFSPETARLSWRQRLQAAFLRSDAAQGFALLSPTLVVMLFAMGAPFVLTVVMSFWTQVGFDFVTEFSTGNYQKIADGAAYHTLMTRSLSIAGACAVATVLISYPMAYYVAFYVHRRKTLWIILMTLPFWTSYLLRVFAWKVILGWEGVINSGLMSAGLITEPIEALLYSPSAVVITLTHAWAAFAILPLYISLEKIDRSLLEAAADLGDGPVWRFLRVTLPLSLPGIVASMLLIFVPTVGDFVTPALVGGPDGLMIANMIQAQFGLVNNWPMGAALAVTMMVLLAIIAMIYIWLTKLITERIV